MKGLVALVCILVLLAGVGIYCEGKKWDRFVVDHHCKVVGRLSGDLVPVFGGDGKVGVGATPDKTGWQCDDGVTYWR